ncbi:hypothetical protein BDW74DRAFT_184054 [Aspergillus multicolor]|uniref:uncharacterized protein n=1 Tax=Aspergillus multicolor TaxID=41759 RepID=UPI003CCCBAB8
MKLRAILESPKIPKGFFGVRRDCHALYVHYRIELQGVRNIQLMDNALRGDTAVRKYLWGLAKATNQAPGDGICQLSPRDLHQWSMDKIKEERICDSNHGGGWEMLAERPLTKQLMTYCVGEVLYLPLLYKHFHAAGAATLNQMVADMSQKRVLACQKENYLSNAPGRALSTWSSEQNRQPNMMNWKPGRPEYLSASGSEEEDAWGGYDYDYDYDYRSSPDPERDWQEKYCGRRLYPWDDPQSEDIEQSTIDR